MALVEMADEEIAARCKTNLDGISLLGGRLSLTLLSIRQAPPCSGGFQLQDGSPSVMNCTYTPVFNQKMTPDVAVRGSCGEPTKV
jgi:hypothetical protein